VSERIASLPGASYIPSVSERSLTPDQQLDKRITVVIPAKNEARSLRELLPKITQITGNILLVDGHSTDESESLATKHGIRVVKDNQLGKGDAIRCAIPNIETEITVFIDADGSHDPGDIRALVQPILDDRFDHVSGSRLIGGSSELHGGFDECFRLMGSSFITACINWRYGVRISESQNGFRAIKTEVLRALNLRENITTIEQEMIMKTLKLGYRLGEVPTHEYPRKYGSSHITLWRVAPRYVWTLFRYLL